MDGRTGNFLWGVEPRKPAATLRVGHIWQVSRCVICAEGGASANTYFPVSSAFFSVISFLFCGLEPDDFCGDPDG